MDIEQSLLNIEIEILFRTIGNIKSALKDAEQRNRFFREYRDHSKVLTKVILRGLW